MADDVAAAVTLTALAMELAPATSGLVVAVPLSGLVVTVPLSGLVVAVPLATRFPFLYPSSYWFVAIDPS